MSRIGKKPVILPAGVTAELASGVLTVKGPKGTLTQEVHPKALITMNTAEGANELIVNKKKKEPIPFLNNLGLEQVQFQMPVDNNVNFWM